MSSPLAGLSPLKTFILYNIEREPAQKNVNSVHFSLPNNLYEIFNADFFYSGGRHDGEQFASKMLFDNDSGRQIRPIIAPVSAVGWEIRKYQITDFH